MSDLPPDQAIHGSLALDVFGKSYHTNRYARWNETNPGLGVTAAFEHTSERDESPSCDYVLSVGTYRDSFNDQAKYALAGLRFMVGSHEGLHGSCAASIGILDGSGNQGLDIVPVLALGYDRVDLCVTGMYSPNTNGQRDKQGRVDPRIATTSLIACFLSITLFRF